MPIKPRVLAVDDEERNLRLMEAMLLPMGYEFFKAHSGEEALDIVRETPPDVVLLDIMMPGVNGFEVARRLKANEDTRIIPIIMVTALKEVDDRVKALDAGADDFLTKPVDKLELKARVANSLKIKAYNDHMRSYQKDLETEIAKRTRELELAYERVKDASLDTIHRLSRAAEYKDEHTGDHIQRMSQYSVAIAKEIGLGQKILESILYAAPMHDIGKIGIPDRILLKPRRLEPEEWEIMKRHTVIGAQILQGSDVGFIKLAEVIAMTHHERWDGAGYPNGLCERQIPLVGRISAVADVFDALTSRRPYKEPISVEDSFAIIAEGRSLRFDPVVVDAFFSAKPEILAIKRKHPDTSPSKLVEMAELPYT
ncbi:HD domain-containing phosphohydrolase [Desulfatibacillum aliphaticivorans]|uniref:Response regulator receiver modulated metal dependent phosphohydrolase n=1 Tax=Desulfatibacillum aliphaticivorans TaxID=218208 RepID=B8FBF1_DESAL|nr:HD domain-containing phosphohydrolase [Desulfatibacillum aliphaticivorans]ACL04595.1 response regulator receiver modulated metal dependent phosphohydrolase [Desulfatibacillum aliphaticivorans]